MLDLSQDFRLSENFGIGSQMSEDDYDLSDNFELGVKGYLSNSPAMVYTCSESKFQSFNYQSPLVEDSLKNIDEISNLGHIAEDNTLHWDQPNDALNLAMNHELGVSKNLFEEFYKNNTPQVVVNKTVFERMDFLDSSSNEGTQINQKKECT